ncbi:MAG: alpha-D-ribose 1-methylphosphonate 5-triphosphate diphosphatase [Roseiarcus sp.]|jgi:alpha-D-ribose 1-methylphosphonate 5-triphosphate diphosphatase|uniref:alpha-D-ribose 1-methylphosphonate 5-triphosphate diphosphatase n=1 Tax=Roseiarcus sp. TaxID=1969460 RepID=UPI003C260ACE
MEFHAADPLVLTNAKVVAADRVFLGWVATDHGRIVETGEGHGPKGAIDCQGDYLLPGLVELHTDHLEAHFMPRPRVFWHAGSAVMAYDAQIATAGITTVFDSFRVGMDEHEDWRSGAGEQVVTLADAIERARAADLLRADHQTHLRCEIPAPNVVEFLEEFLTQHPARLVSLMDHTPGQRQFRDLDKYFIYYQGKTGKSERELAEVVRERQRVGRERADANRPRIVALAHAHGLTLASHDDTTLDDVEQAKREGVHIAEFPTTHEAAAASRDAGMATVMGAPNVVRGGSHSGNASARDLAEAGLLDILSSDYVPAALLMAAFHLADAPSIGGLAGAVRLVTKNPAEAAGLIDRGEIVVGRRADLVRVRAHHGEPVARAVWREGVRVA